MELRAPGTRRLPGDWARNACLRFISRCGIVGEIVTGNTAGAPPSTAVDSCPPTAANTATATATTTATTTVTTAATSAVNTTRLMQSSISHVAQPRRVINQQQHAVAVLKTPVILPVSFKALFPSLGSALNVVLRVTVHVDGEVKASGINVVVKGFRVVSGLDKILHQYSGRLLQGWEKKEKEHNSIILKLGTKPRLGSNNQAPAQVRDSVPERGHSFNSNDKARKAYPQSPAQVRDSVPDRGHSFNNNDRARKTYPPAVSTPQKLATPSPTSSSKKRKHSTVATPLGGGGEDNDCLISNINSIGSCRHQGDGDGAADAAGAPCGEDSVRSDRSMPKEDRRRSQSKAQTPADAPGPLWSSMLGTKPRVSQELFKKTSASAMSVTKNTSLPPLSASRTDIPSFLDSAFRKRVPPREEVPSVRTASKAPGIPPRITRSTMPSVVQHCALDNSPRPLRATRTRLVQSHVAGPTSNKAKPPRPSGVQSSLAAARALSKVRAARTARRNTRSRTTLLLAKPVGGTPRRPPPGGDHQESTRSTTTALLTNHLLRGTLAGTARQIAAETLPYATCASPPSPSTQASTGAAAQLGPTGPAGRKHQAQHAPSAMDAGAGYSVSPGGAQLGPTGAQGPAGRKPQAQHAPSAMDAGVGNLVSPGGHPASGWGTSPGSVIARSTGAPSNPTDGVAVALRATLRALSVQLGARGLGGGSEQGGGREQGWGREEGRGRQQGGGGTVSHDRARGGDDGEAFAAPFNEHRNGAEEGRGMDSRTPSIQLRGGEEDDLGMASGTPSSQQRIGVEQGMYMGVSAPHSQQRLNEEQGMNMGSSPPSARQRLSAEQGMHMGASPPSAQERPGHRGTPEASRVHYPVPAFQVRVGKRKKNSKKTLPVQKTGRKEGADRADMSSPPAPGSEVPRQPEPQTDPDHARAPEFNRPIHTSDGLMAMHALIAQTQTSDDPQESVQVRTTPWQAYKRYIEHLKMKFMFPVGHTDTTLNVSLYLLINGRMVSKAIQAHLKKSNTTGSAHWVCSRVGRGPAGFPCKTFVNHTVRWNAIESSATLILEANGPALEALHTGILAPIQIGNQSGSLSLPTSSHPNGEEP
eukprot:gene25894-11567_t